MKTMTVDVLPLGAYQTNCYIVRADGANSCAVIDPGYAPEQVLRFVSDRSLSVDAVLLTHGHFDHVGAVEIIVKETGCALWMSQGDWSQEKSAQTAHYYPLANCDFVQVEFCEEGQELCAGGVTFTVMETPGHTWGSVCYRCEDALFSGDTLFAGSCGRVDLPGGDWNTITESLARLARLPGDPTVYPGHGESTTLEWERKTNPYMR